jgi:hypothetical protein
VVSLGRAFPIHSRELSDQPWTMWYLLLDPSDCGGMRAIWRRSRLT